MTSDDMLRALLLLDILGMALLAIFYLRHRPLSWLAFLGWGLLAVLVPVLGPFLVIAARPGAVRSRKGDSWSSPRGGGTVRWRDRLARSVEKDGLPSLYHRQGGTLAPASRAGVGSTKRVARLR